jgi:SAM-dependent methyltransferase
VAGRGETLTSEWVDASALERLAGRYAEHNLADISYATVRDYVDSFENIKPLAEAQGDLKDVQRPWTLKAILARVPRGASVAEIGGGTPYVADLLARLGYEVWLVDPYDGSANGPTDYALYRRRCPGVRFVRSSFDDRLVAFGERSLGAIFSISVLEHLDEAALQRIFRGTQLFLAPDGVAIHAIDHVHRGRGDRDHLARLRGIVDGLGLSTSKLEEQLARLTDDTETYYLSAESHNRWRGRQPYNEFPMRVCVGIQTVSTAGDLERRWGRQLSFSRRTRALGRGA